MAGYPGYGALLVRNGVEIAQVRDITGPSLKQDAIDVGTRDDASQGQSLGGLRDGGDVSFDLSYDPILAGHQAIPAAFDSGEIDQMQLHVMGEERPNGVRFSALITKFEPKAPLRDALTALATYRLSGEVVPIVYLVDHMGNYLVAHNGSYLIA